MDLKPKSTEGEYYYEIYSIQIEIDGNVISTDECWPEFVLVRWKDEPRLLALRFE